MENNKELSERILKFYETFNKAKEENYGFIMIPSNNGFDIHRIKEDRLHLYLQTEALYSQSQTKKNHLERLNKKKAEYFKQSDDDILKSIEDYFGKDVLEDI